MGQGLRGSKPPAYETMGRTFRRLTAGTLRGICPAGVP